MFSELFVYCCAHTTSPRDIAQAMLRVRKLTTNRMTYTIDESSFTFPLTGRDAILADIEATRESHRSATGDLNIVWESMPQWMIDTHVYNAQEEADKAYNFTATMNEYLRLSGYKITEEEVEDVKIDMEKTVVFSEDIQDITWQTAAEIGNRKRVGLATAAEIFMLEKFKFQSQLTPEAVERDGELWDRFTKEKLWPKFWKVVNDKHASLKQVLVKESASRFAELSDPVVAQREVNAKLLKVLGWKSMEDGGDIPIADVVEGLKALEKEVCAAYSRDKKPRRNTEMEFGQNSALKMLKMVFAEWNGSVAVVAPNAPKKTVVVEGVKKRVTVYTVSVTPADWYGVIAEAQHRKWRGRAPPPQDMEDGEDGEE